MEKREIHFLGDGEVPAALEEMISNAIEISIASAFLNFAGLNILKKFLEKYNQVRSVRILLDENFHHEESTKKELLIKLCALPNTEVRVFSDRNRHFHAKIYIFGGAESVDVIVGSSNLTSGGLFHNVEVNTLFGARAADPEIIKLTKFYQESWEKSQPAGVFLRTLGGGMGIYNFKIGDKVVISSKLEFGIGTIVGIEGEQADIFFKEKGIAETAHIADLQSALEPLDLAKAGQFDDPIKFDLRTRALFLPIANKNGILSNSIIEILPHQILAAHKVISSKSRRFLLADEVGLGKTFEAGIIIKELASRGEAERVLFITPAGLVEQWQGDMEKFGFSLTAYLTGMEGAIKDFWNKMSPVITSIDTIKIEEHLKDLMSAKDWDVIVFDEAHHLTRKDYGVKADKSDRYVVGEKLKDKTKSLLFLTATPHQGDRNKFYNLVSLLDENIFKDEDDLSKNRERLNQIMIRQKKIDVTDEEGKPLFVKRIVTALRYEISKEEKDFFDALNLYLLTGYRAAERDIDKRYRALGFVMITFQKIAASSIYAIRMAFEERLIRLLFIEMAKGKSEKSPDEYKRGIISFLRYKYEPTVNDERVFQEAKENFEKYLREENVDPLEFVAAPDEIESLKNLLSKIPSDEDTKFKRLIEALNLIKTKNNEEKAIIFTEYLKTQDYIVSKLKRIYGEDDVVFIRGGDNQQKILAAKKFKKSAHFLVSTQAGGEGINLQHCHIMINYDMPWNPMKVEQRIGRIHRYGQAETAQVYNLFAAGTIEDRIYQRLDMKLEDITRDIGDEEEREAFRENILGILAEQLNFEELYREVLKQGREIEKITQDKIDDAVKRAQEIYEKLGDFTQNMERFNLQKYFKTKGNLSLDDLKQFVLDYVKSEGKRVSEDNEGNYEFIIPDSIQSYGGHKIERVTFDREKAIGEPSMEFMGIGHYLTDEIIRKCSGYGYGGRCARRQIQDSKYKGEKGIQANYTIEFQVPQSGEGKNKTLGRHFQTIVFDENLNYRKDFGDLGLIQSDKKINEEEFFFADRTYLGRIEKLLNEKVQEVIDEKIRELRTKYPNVVYKKALENIAIFALK